MESRFVGEAALHCPIALMNLVKNSLFVKDKDIRELNLLLSKFKYRSNTGMLIGDHLVEGFVNRLFVKSDALTADGDPTPSNNLKFSVVRGDRDFGIREIARRTMTVNEEHGWAFIQSKNLWIDLTLAVEEKRIYFDPILIQALQEKYRAIEVYHSHPLKITSEVQRERNFKMNALVSGAMPTVTDLMTLTHYAWNLDRSVPQIEGIIHPLGVTYYMPTLDLLTSRAGPPLKDIGNYEYIDTSKLPHQQAISTLLSLQEDGNRIQRFDGSREPRGFKMKFFALDELPSVNEWLKNNSAALSKEDAEKYKRRNR